MKRFRLFSFTIFSWVIGAMGASALAQTVNEGVVGKAEGDKASVVLTVPHAFDSAQSLTSQQIVQMFETVPFVTNVQIISEGKETIAQTSTTFQKKTTDSFFLLKFSDTKIMDESLFKVTRSVTRCQSGQDCSPSVEVKIIGPVHSYGHFVEAKSRPTINKTYELNLTLEPGTAPVIPPAWMSYGSAKNQPTKPAANATAFTQVTMQLDIQNHSYEDYLRDLAQRKVLAQVPTEKEIQMAFMVWGQSAVAKLDLK